MALYSFLLPQKDESSSLSSSLDSIWSWRGSFPSCSNNPKKEKINWEESGWSSSCNTVSVQVPLYYNPFTPVLIFPIFFSAVSTSVCRTIASQDYIVWDTGRKDSLYVLLLVEVCVFFCKCIFTWICKINQGWMD